MHNMPKWIKIAIGIMFFVVALQTHAQEKKEKEKRENVFLHPDKFYKKYFPDLKIKYNPSDSNYIKTYPKNYMTVALRVLSPKIYANITPTNFSNASSDFRTNINTITGLSFSYRHITAGFALSLLPPIGDSPDYVHTKYHTATIKYKSPVYILTFRYMKIKGFTDVNSFNAEYSFENNIQRPDISLKEYEFEAIYNFNWKKYSYLATIDYTESQIKSRIGFMLKAGIYNQQLYSDTNLFSAPQRPYFDAVHSVSKMVGYTFKISPGIGGNIVIKKNFYAAISFFSPISFYLNYLYTNDKQLLQNQANVQWLLDGSMSIGYRTNRFYTAIRLDVDGRSAALNTLMYTSVYNYIGLDIGYRFITPRFIKKFYKDTMPPGM